MTRPEGLTTSLYSLGEKLFVSVCSSCQAKVSGAIDAFLSTLGVSRDSILGIFAKGNLPLRYISNLPLGVTNEGREAIICPLALVRIRGPFGMRRNILQNS